MFQGGKSNCKTQYNNVNEWCCESAEFQHGVKENFPQFDSNECADENDTYFSNQPFSTIVKNPTNADVSEYDHYINLNSEKKNIPESFEDGIPVAAGYIVNDHEGQHSGFNPSCACLPHPYECDEHKEYFTLDSER